MVLEVSALIPIFSVLLSTVSYAASVKSRFRSELKSLESHLALIKRMIDDEELVNKKMQQETEMLSRKLFRGEKLVRKCTKVKSWNLVKRWHYTRELKKFEDSLMKFFQIDVAFIQYRNVKEMSVQIANNEKMSTVILNKLLLNSSGCFGQSFQERELVEHLLYSLSVKVGYHVSS